MSNPSVACVMLTRDRGGMNYRALRSFRSQTYENKGLLILDTGDPSWAVNARFRENETHWAVKESGMSIGELRNYANEYVTTWPIGSTDIFAHWDSDDWSHPNRLAEQVALLQATGADCVGYNTAVFWDERRMPLSEIPGWALNDGCVEMIRGAAWLYTNPMPTYAIGASLMYWRTTWERRTFDPISHGEDARFTQHCRTVGVPSTLNEEIQVAGVACEIHHSQPRIVCGVHGGNSSHAYDFSKRSGNFRRAPQFDEYCRSKMEL